MRGGANAATRTDGFGPARSAGNRRYAQISFARRVADDVVVFERGAIIEQGPPTQIFDAPLVV